MTYLAPGIAHVSFAGGGLFFVARDTTQREGLIAEVMTRLHLHDTVQVLFENHRWLVRRGEGHSTCVQCGQTAAPATTEGTKGQVPYCLTCAFSAPPPKKHAGLPRSVDRVTYTEPDLRAVG